MIRHLADIALGWVRRVLDEIDRARDWDEDEGDE